MFPRVAQFKDVASFRRRLAELQLEIPVDDRTLAATDGSPLAAPISLATLTIGNRWCIHPMEGWDGTRDGHPSPHTLRRWRHFGLSGAKLIWGGEAAALQHDG
ncbi:MAG: NADH:flavin oxidoreductase, partial [Planctomycetaceae bacterium]|nr:NADH:flavin oxidoreductase [Planctomycetaceae bacterium]